MNRRLFQSKAREWFRRTSALDRLKAFVGLRDMPHGLRMPTRLWFPDHEIARRTWVSPLRLVRISDLIALQDDVGPEDVERHVRNPRLVPVVPVATSPAATLIILWSSRCPMAFSTSGTGIIGSRPKS